MKSLMICLVAFGSMAALPTISSARDRSAEAAAVASSLGLETGSYRVLSTTEAEQVRGTGGCLMPLIKLPTVIAAANVNVNAKVNVLNVVNVKANANAHAFVLVH